MKRMILAITVALAMHGVCCAADAVEPASTTITNIRAEAVVAVPGGQFYQGTSLLFTNCICFADSTGTTTQGLGDVTVTLTVGNNTSNVSYTATTYASGGDSLTNMWAIPITVIDGENTQNIQIKLEDINANVYIYPWKILQNRSQL